MRGDGMGEGERSEAGPEDVRYYGLPEDGLPALAAVRRLRAIERVLDASILLLIAAAACWLILA